MAETQEEAKTSVKKLRDEGNGCFAKQDYDQALKKYKDATEICEEHHFERELAVLTSNMAAVYLKLNSFEEALECSNKSLELNPEYFKGYFRKAEACKQLALMDSEKRAGYCQSAIDAYLKAFELSQCTDDDVDKTFCRAIVFAVDCGHTGSLEVAARQLDQKLFVRLLEIMMKSKETKGSHFKFLLAITSHIKGEDEAVCKTKFQCSSLLDKEDIDDETLQAFLNAGTYLVPKDIDKLIDILPDSATSTAIIKTITDTGCPEQVNFLCKKSLDTKKFKFAAHFISCGAQPEVADIESCVTNWKDVNKDLLCYISSERARLLNEAIWSGEFDEADRILDSTLPLNTKELDLTSYLKFTSIPVELVRKLLDKGVDPNNGNPLDAAFGLDNNIIRKMFPIIRLLVEKGAKVNTSTLFKMTEIALTRNPGNSELDTLKAVYDHFDFPKDGKVINDDGQTPWHLAMSAKRNHGIKVCEILCSYHIDRSIKDKRGRRADCRIRGSDQRLVCFHKVEQFLSQHLPTEEPIRSRRAKNEVTGDDCSPAVDETDLHNETPEQSDDPTETAVTLPFVAAPEPDITTNIPTESSDVWTSITSHLENIFTKENDYFTKVPDVHQDDNSSQDVNNGENNDSESISSLHEASPEPAVLDQEIVDQKDTNTGDTNIEDSNTEDVSDFDGLTWEVECTDEVLKFLGNKKTPPHLRKLAVQKIHRIANGEFPGNNELCKSVSKKKGFELYEAKLTKSDRILWEVAIHYSKRSTEVPHVQHVYSDVIKVWKVVLNHDRIHHGVKQIERCVRQIEEAHSWGTRVSKECIIPLIEKSSIQHEPNKRIPRLYVDAECDQQTKDQVKTSLFPPATPEGNLLKCYVFSSAVAQSVLQQGSDNLHRKYPFDESKEEHDIIKMPDNESILLVGRSGTGKTTCCLYRLMNQFHHWSGNEATSQLIPRARLPNPNPESDFEPQYCSPSAVRITPNPDDGADLDAGLCKETGQDLECLHQVFVSKNHVLCAEMKKQFYEMTSEAKINMPFRLEELPNSFSFIDDTSYPLFLTGRNLFLLLDNSLNGESFFPRDDDGGLKVKILSSDYDYGNPNTRVDLQLTDSESEDDYQDESEHCDTAWREVTASYFVNHIWHKISDSCTERIDPLLVWMEIKSFIKGSKEAVEKECGYLELEEYQELGKKMAPHFLGNRGLIYKIFQNYQKFRQGQRHDRQLYDECDFIHNLYHRLDEHIPWSIHILYVDEVQDFSQAELQLLLSCCRCPNGHFLTGDTAQCIMRGISFRFKDLTTIFHDAKLTSQKSLQVKVTVPKLKKLTINFRSDSGILRLAASVLDILAHFFPTSFDSDLPPDKAMFDKPKSIPVLLQLSENDVNDLALIMYGNRREASNIQFGAHQAVIVQSEEAKEEAAAFLSGNILTVYEAKGLEFDDVLLYNFFNCSSVKDAWRVVTSFLEECQLPDVPDSNLFSTHPLKFDDTQHKSLSVELKYLYTAITRAKHNLWIYESDRECKWLPMFDYWHRRGLVKVVCVEDIGKLNKEEQNILFPVEEFKKEDWKKQGDHFSEKHLWELARKCYERAEETHLQTEANAYFLVQHAEKLYGIKSRRKSAQKLYLQATSGFLECDRLNHDVKHLMNAATCLMNGKKYREAAELFEKLRQYTLAFKGYKRLKDVDGCIRVKEQAGDYSGAVQYQMSLNLRAGLVLAAKYAKQGVYISSQRIEGRALFYSKRYAQKKDQGKLLSIIGCVANVSQRVALLKEANLFVEASELLICNKQYYAAFRILSAQGEHLRGIELAEKLKDSEMRIKFVFQSAVAQLCNSGNVTDPQVLEKLEGLSTETDPPIKAKACLLLGKTLMEGDPKKAAKLFYEAYSIYKSSYPNQVGEIESFNLFSKVKRFQQAVSPIKFVEACVETSRTAVEVAKSLRRVNRPAFAIHTVHRAEEFYTLQKAQDIYFLVQDQDLWVGKLKKIKATDEDGMMKLGAQRTLYNVAKHLEDYIPKWNDHDMVETLKFKLQSFPFHKQLVEQKNLTHSYRSCPPVQLKQYLDVCILALDFEDFSKSKTFPEIHQIMLRIFSPLNMLYLPFDGKMHFSELRKSNVACEVLKDGVSHTMMRKDLECVKVDEWLEVWKMNNILCEHAGSNLYLRLQQWTDEVNYRYIPWYPPPFYTFIYKVRQHKYQHFFFFWMESCKCIRQGNVINAVKLSLDNFVCVIARRRSLRSISVINLVNILSVYTTAVFAALSYSGFPRTQRYTFIVPHTFRHIVESFDELNCQKSEDHCVLSACAQNYVQKAMSFQQLERKAFDLLWRILEILTGRYNERYHVLQYAVRLKARIESGEALHCLVLALTLLGNLALLRYEEPYINGLRKNIYDALKHIPTHVGECAKPLLEIRETLAYCTDARDILRSMILKLLTSIDSRDAGLLGFRVVQKQQLQLATVSFVDIPSHRVPRRQLTPLLHSQKQPLPVSVQHTATENQADNAGSVAEEGKDKQSDHEQTNDSAEQPRVSPDFNRTTSYPGADEPGESETHDDDAYDTDDPDINEILDKAEQIVETVPDFTPEEKHKEDVSLIDENFCIACGENVNSKIYEAHCASEQHKQNVDLCKAFKVAEKQYRQGVAKLERFVLECQTIEKRTPSLDDLISSITNKLRENEQQINEAKQKYNWSKGISEMENEINTLLKHGQMKLQEARSKDTTVSDKDDTDVMGEDSDTDLDDRDEPLPVSGANQKPRQETKRKGTLRKHRKKKT